MNSSSTIRATQNVSRAEMHSGCRADRARVYFYVVANLPPQPLKKTLTNGSLNTCPRGSEFV